MSEENTAVVVKEEKAPLVMGKNGFEINDLAQAYRYAKVIVASGMGVKSDTPEAVVIKLEFGRQLGLSNMASIQNIACINGRPSIWGDAALALVRSSGLVDLFEESFSEDGTMAICRTKRKGEASIHERTFSMEDAKIAGLAGKVGPWKQYPRRMMQMRARSWCMRDVYPDVLKGIAMAEEVRDMADEPFIEIAPVEDAAATKTDKLVSKIKARKEPKEEPPTPTIAKEEKADPEPPKAEPEQDHEETPLKVERGSLVADIQKMAKYKKRTFNAWLKDHGLDADSEWSEQLTDSRLVELYDVLMP